MKQRVYVRHWYSQREMPIHQAFNFQDEAGAIDIYRLTDTIAQLVDALNETGALPPEKILNVLRAAGVHDCGLIEVEEIE